MKVKYIDKFYVAGITTRTSNEIEKNESTTLIPALWQKYVDENIESKTFNKSKNMAMYGIFSKYDENFEYDYTLGVEVTKPKNSITIERNKYLIFTKKGELPQIVLDVWDEVDCYFKSPECNYERAYNIDFEKYVNSNEIEIYISIKK